jgi:HEPN domain-containing protein
MQKPNNDRPEKPFSCEGWLLKASNEFRSAKKLIQGDDKILDTAIYHTQQAAEKALKAFLVFNKQSFLKTHDLEKILTCCESFEKAFGGLRASAALLNPYGTFFRYPDNFFEPALEDVIEAIENAEKILNFVKKIIKEQQNPTGKLF